jgi:nitrate/nitrite-specific signal transduction histidine kinase
MIAGRSAGTRPTRGYGEALAPRARLREPGHVALRCLIVDDSEEFPASAERLLADVAGRPPEAIEIATYYVVSEALTNAAKHSEASLVTVTITTVGTVLRTTIEDDGVGGAHAAGGSGLIGLIDRVEALGGRLALHSPPGRGTTISIELPLETPAELKLGDDR